jgi:hypothetical protein
MHTLLPLATINYIGPAVGACLFVLVMSFVKEPTRLTLNAIIMGGASGVYLSGGFGPWELVYPAIATPIVYFSLRSYRFVALGWIMHAGWDVVHLAWGNPIWPFMPTSSLGCAIFDTILGLWLFADTRTVSRWRALAVAAASKIRTQWA